MSRPDTSTRQCCQPSLLPPQMNVTGSGRAARLPSALVLCCLSPPKAPRGLQTLLRSRGHAEPEANRAFSHGPGQASLPSLKVAILFQAECSIGAGCVWRLGLIVDGVVTPDHSQPSARLPPPNLANSALHHYAINFAGVSLEASCELQMTTKESLQIKMK